MPCRAIAVVLVTLLGTLTATAAAEPVRITSGHVFVPGITEPGDMNISGTQGFSLSAIVGNNPNAFWTCSVPECVGGTPLDLFFQLGGPLLSNARATLNGVTYPDVDGAISPAYTNSDFYGTAFAPPVSGGPETITAPFTFVGGFYLAGSGLLRELTGAGTATLFLRPYEPLDGFAPSWSIDAIRYDFAETAPVPEPATLTLTATALAGAYLARRRRGQTLLE
jgi:hypothetical protein